MPQVRNAEPYREFQSSEDNDRYYGMNEVLIWVRGLVKCLTTLQGYWRNLAVNPLNLPQGPQPAALQVNFSQQKLSNL